MPYQREAAIVLEMWREVERDLGAAIPESAEAEALQTEAATARRVPASGPPGCRSRPTGAAAYTGRTRTRSHLAGMDRPSVGPSKLAG